MTSDGISAGRASVAEGVGTALLLCAIVGSGIMGERLSGGNIAIALLANSVATGAALFCLIVTFGSISGAHLNPVVTIADAAQGGLPRSRVAPYLAGQFAGAAVGVLAAHVMFQEPLVRFGTRVRGGGAGMFSEALATFGLLSVIWGCSRRRAALAPFAVAAYITGAYWFTSSTSFANPAVTAARALTDTFAGIRPADVPGFIASQCVGAAAATMLFRWLIPEAGEHADQVIVPHSESRRS